MVLSVCVLRKCKIPRQSTVALLGGGVAVISAIYIFSEFYDLCSPAPRMAASGASQGSSQQGLNPRLSGIRIKTLPLNIRKLAQFLHILYLLSLLHHRTATPSEEIPPSPSFPRLPVAARAELWSAAAAVFSQHNSLPFSQPTTGTVQISSETKMLCSNYFASNSDVFSLFWKAADISNCKNIPWFILANYNSKVIKTKLNSISKNNTRVLLLLMLWPAPVISSWSWNSAHDLQQIWGRAASKT